MSCQQFLMILCTTHAIIIYIVDDSATSQSLQKKLSFNHGRERQYSSKKCTTNISSIISNFLWPQPNHNVLLITVTELDTDHKYQLQWSYVLFLGGGDTRKYGENQDTFNYVKPINVVLFVLLYLGWSIKHKSNKLGLSWAKLSSNWNWNSVLLDLKFVAFSSYFDCNQQLPTNKHNQLKLGYFHAHLHAY